MPVVHVDRMRITEILVNLIENSLKYIGLQTNPEIEIGQRIDGKDRIFFVRDNGIGIDPSQYDKVFELFYKVNKESEGTGAGLAIVKRIIEVHGGRIWIESELGKGCTDMLYIAFGRLPVNSCGGPVTSILPVSKLIFHQRPQRSERSGKHAENTQYCGYNHHIAYC